jgi:hypothetical protein
MAWIRRTPDPPVDADEKSGDTLVFGRPYQSLSERNTVHRIKRALGISDITTNLPAS